jgi:hypothetical protein
MFAAAPVGAAGLAALDLSPVDDMEPKVTIEEHHNRTVEEYRVNNNLYMVKITPKAGKPYYLVDPDGSGTMEWRRNSLGMDVQAPRWTLLRW